MKSAYEVHKLEDKLRELLLRHDIKMGEPISKDKYLPLAGYEYDAITHNLSVIVPLTLSHIVLAWFIKQGLENVTHHEIAGTSYMKIIVFL